MTLATTQSDALHELAHRESDGVEVTLYWNRHDDSLIVSVLDTRTGDFFDLNAPRERGLDVFYHPYSYAASCGVVFADALLAA